jgi:hypothetical protein
MEQFNKDIIRQRFHKSNLGIDWMVPARFHQITDYKLIDKITISFILKFHPTDFEQFWAEFETYISVTN